MGLIEILLVLAGLIVLIFIGKAVSRLFRRSGHETNYGGGYTTQRAGFRRTTNIKFDSMQEKKTRDFQKRAHETAQKAAQKAMQDAQRAAQNAQKISEDMRKRNEAIRRQTDETVRNMTKRSRGW